MGANGAKVVAGANQLVEAALVNEMIARRDLTRLATRVNVLLADGAVGPREILDAAMSAAVEVGRQAHVARRAVEEVIAAADATNAAAVAVKLILLLVIVQFAFVAKILKNRLVIITKFKGN